jgi:hypothetical protein
MSDDGFANVARRLSGFVGATDSSYVAALWTVDEGASRWLGIGRVEKGRAALSLYVTAASLADQYSVFIGR